jgi:hypothetical protein
MTENFIMSIKNGIDETICKDLILFFENSPNLHNPGNSANNQVNTEFKKSTDITIIDNTTSSDFYLPLLRNFIDNLHDQISKYVNYYSFSSNSFEVGIKSLEYMNFERSYNLQRYLPGEGFYHWHSENISIKTSYRQLSWMVYLNTITDQGGTEFKFQNHTETAEVGKVVIWPAFWTHLHRGIPSKTQTKYIATGWVNYS